MTRQHPGELRQLPVFATLPKHALAVADSMLTPTSFRDGTEFCTANAVARQAFIILDGSAVVTRDGEQIAVVGPGDIVGELALLDGLPRTATVTATGPVEALVMTPQEFNSILALPGVEEEIRRIATGRKVTNDGPTTAPSDHSG